MLHFLESSDTSLKWPLFKELDPSQSLILVPDIKTKQALEDEFLKKEKILPGLFILRAEEFYKELFYRMDLPWSLVSDTFIKNLFFEFCESSKEPWIKNSSNSPHFFEFFKSSQALLFHPEGLSLFTEWLEEKGKKGFSKNLIQLFQDFFETLREKKMIAEGGLKALLFDNLDLIDEKTIPKDKIFLDLSFSLDLVEKKIFERLSKEKEVLVFTPKSLYSDSLVSFTDMYEKWMKEETIPSQIHSIGDVKKTFLPNLKAKTSKAKVFRVSKSETQIEEALKAITQVRNWIEKGVDKKDIAIFAPNMEAYWPLFKIYLKKENIPVRKTLFSRLVHFSEVQAFLSSLRLHMGKISFEDLERYHFLHPLEKNPEDYSAFYQKYFEVPDRKMSKKLLIQKRQITQDKKMTGEEFLKWASFFLSSDMRGELLDKITQGLQVLPRHLILKASSWLRVLEENLSLIDIQIEGEKKEAISCLSFNAFSSSKASHVFVLGLSEEALKKPVLSLFNENDRQSLLQDLDFPLILPQAGEKQDSLLWFLQSSHLSEVFLSSASHDLTGSVQTDSWLLFFSKTLFKASEVSLPVNLHMESFRRAPHLNEILDQSQIRSDQKKLLKEGFERKEKSCHVKMPPSHISPSQLKKYNTCPFQYAGEYLFCEKEMPNSDRELSIMTKGSLFHKLFEEFLKQYPSLEISDEEMDKLILKITPKEKEIIHEEQKEILASSLKWTLKKFLQYEKEKQERCPGLKPLAFEKEVEGFWNKEKAELSKKGKYPVKLIIDRIDKKGDSYAVIDYKRSSTSFLNIKSAAKEGREDFQLIFYAEALKKGLIEGVKGDLGASFYLFYGEDFFVKGYIDKQGEISEVDGKSHSSKKTNALVFEEASKAIFQRASEIIKGMEEGEFSSKPIKKNCERCSYYQNLCRVEVLGED